MDRTAGAWDFLIMKLVACDVRSMNRFAGSDWDTYSMPGFAGRDWSGLRDYDVTD